MHVDGGIASRGLEMLEITSRFSMRFSGSAMAVGFFAPSRSPSVLQGEGDESRARNVQCITTGLRALSTVNNNTLMKVDAREVKEKQREMEDGE